MFSLANSYLTLTRHLTVVLSAGDPGGVPGGGGSHVLRNVGGRALPDGLTPGCRRRAGQGGAYSQGTVQLDAGSGPVL